MSRPMSAVPHDFLRGPHRRYRFDPIVSEDSGWQSGGSMRACRAKLVCHDPPRRRATGRGGSGHSHARSAWGAPDALCCSALA